MCLIVSSFVVQMKFKTSEVYLCVGWAQNLSVKWIISVAVMESPSPETLGRCYTPILGGCGVDPLHGQLGFVPDSALADAGKRSKASLWCPSSSFQWLGWPVACTASAAEAGGKKSENGASLKYLGSFLTSQWHKPLSWEWTLGEEHKTDFADPINLLLWKPCGTPVPVVPPSWSFWCEAKTLLKSLHPLCLVISLDTVVRLSQTVSGWRRARPVQPFSLTCRAVLNFSRCKHMQVDRVPLRDHLSLDVNAICISIHVFQKKAFGLLSR